MIGFENDKTRYGNSFDDDMVLTEMSFYPPEDDRLYASNIDDIEGGDNFAEYAEWFWEEYGFELYDEIDF